MGNKRNCALMVFDFDGTLADTLSSIAYFGNAALAKFGYPEIPIAEYAVLVGDGAKTLIERMLKRVKGEAQDFDKIYELYTQSYDDNPLFLTAPYDGVNELLNILADRGIKTAVCSNKPHQTTTKICNALFGDKLDYCVGKREAVPKKPDPASLLEIVERFGVSLEQAVYVGDTSTDILTGKNAGVFTIGAVWGFRGRSELVEYGADGLADTPLELLSFI